MLVSIRTSVAHLIYICVACLTVVKTMELFNVKYMQSDDSRLIATSNYNYAISSPRLRSRNWRSISVNGDSVMIITTNYERLSQRLSDMPEVDREMIESLRDGISAGNSGFGHFSSSSSSGSSSGPYGGGSMMMSSNSNGGGFSRSFHSSSGGSFSSMSSSSGSGGYGGSFQMNDLSVNTRDQDNFSVSKSGLPYGWSQVFYGRDDVTVIGRDGSVLMSPIDLMEPEKREAVARLKEEVNEMQRNQARQLSNTMQNSMDMVSNVFSNVMGSLPQPPSFQSVGGMFGNNFPFGSANNPFNNFPGLFGGGGGGAMAFASARR